MAPYIERIKGQGRTFNGVLSVSVTLTVLKQLWIHSIKNLKYIDFKAVLVKLCNKAMDSLDPRSECILCAV